MPKLNLQALLLARRSPSHQQGAFEDLETESGLYSGHTAGTPAAGFHGV